MFKSSINQDNRKVAPNEHNDGNDNSDKIPEQNVKFNLTAEDINEYSSDESDDEDKDHTYLFDKKKHAAAALRTLQKNPINRMLDRLNKSLFQAVDRAKVVTQQLIRLQTKEYERKGSLFNYVVQNDLAGLIHYLENLEVKREDFNADKKKIEKSIDPVGANIIHAAYLFKNYEMGRWLVENYPEQAFLPFSSKYDAKKYGEMFITEEDMPYTGENILHMLIVHKNLVEIRWLLEFYDNHKHSVPYGLEILLKTNVKGTFFEDDGDFYCGSYPLHFAVGANSPELFDLILAYFTSVSTNTNQSRNTKQTRTHEASTYAVAHPKTVVQLPQLSEESSKTSSRDDSIASAKPLIKPSDRLKSTTAMTLSHPLSHTMEEEKSTEMLSTEDQFIRHGNVALKAVHQSVDKLANNYFETQEKLTRFIQQGVPWNHRRNNHHGPEREYVSVAEKFRRKFLAKHSTDNLGSNAIFMRDRYGNNCLHLCVIHRLTDMYEHIKKVAASILRQEIKTAYGHFLNMRLKNPHLKTMELKPLPSWDVVHDFNEKEKKGKDQSAADVVLETLSNMPGQLEKTLSRIPTAINNYTSSLELPTRAALMSVKNKSYSDPSSDGVQHAAYRDYSAEGNITEHTQEYHESYKIRNPVWKAYKKHFDNIVERYFPFYAIFSASRLKRKRMDKIVKANELYNGFYYGYSLRESKLYPPVDVDNKPVSQTSFKLWLEEAVQKKIEERFEWVLNERFHSPLTLTSAGMGDDDDKGTDEQEEREKATIQFIINKSKQFRWKYGPVTSNLLYLEGVEVPYDCRRFGMDKRYNSSKPLPPYADAEMFGVVEWICITNSDKSAKIPEVVEIIEEKWRKLGSQVFRYYFFTWCILCLCVTVVVCYGYLSPSTSANTNIHRAVTVIYPLTLFIVIVITVIELPSMLFYGFEYWGILGRRIRGAAKLNKILQTMTSVLFFMICVYKMFEYQDNMNAYAQPNAIPPGSNITSTEDPMVIDVYFTGRKQCEVILVIVVWLNMFYYMMGFEQTGPFVLTVANIVGRDVPFFCTFYVIILIAYSAALNALCMHGSDEMGDSKFGALLLFNGIFDLIQITVNMGLPADSIYVASNVPENLVPLYNFVLTTFYIIVGLMFINLLIGMIGNTYNMYQEYNDALLIMEKYNIMCGLEMSICWFVKTEDRVTKYAIKVEHEILEEPAGKGSIRKSRGKHGTSGKAGGSTKSSKKVPVEELQFPLYAFEIVKNDDSWWLESNMINDKVDSNMTQTLLILDPQNDFHEGFGQPGDPDYVPRGSLAIPGANDDSVRIHDFIMKNMDRIDNIVVTMDSHYVTHIANKCFWKKGPNYGKTASGTGPMQASKRRLPGSAAVTPKTPCPKNRASLLRKTNSSILQVSDHTKQLPNKVNTALNSAQTNKPTHDTNTDLIAEAKLPTNVPTKFSMNAVKLQPLGSVDKSKESHKQFSSSGSSEQETCMQNTSSAAPAVTMAEAKGVSRPRIKVDANPQEVGGGPLRPGLKAKGPSTDSGIHPPDYTVITHLDILDKVWMPVDEDMYDWCLYYTKELENQCKLKLMIWPNHCIIGTPGHAIAPMINEAIQYWATERQRSIQYIMKGQNLKTEMYSALSADVEDPADPSTAFNERFMSKLRISDQIYVCGQAKSHVVKYTLLDILKCWQSSVSKIYLLEDGCSSVPGHEKSGNEFVDDMRKRGVTVLKCSEAFPEKTSQQEKEASQPVNDDE